MSHWNGDVSAKKKLSLERVTGVQNPATATNVGPQEKCSGARWLSNLRYTMVGHIIPLVRNLA